MHSFADLVNRSTNFALLTLKEAEDEVIEALQTSGATRHVKIVFRLNFLEWRMHVHEIKQRLISQGGKSLKFFVGILVGAHSLGTPTES